MIPFRASANELSMTARNDGKDSPELRKDIPELRQHGITGRTAQYPEGHPGIMGMTSRNYGKDKAKLPP